MTDIAQIQNDVADYAASQVLSMAATLMRRHHHSIGADFRDEQGYAQDKFSNYTHSVSIVGAVKAEVQNLPPRVRISYRVLCLARIRSTLALGGCHLTLTDLNDDLAGTPAEQKKKAIKILRESAAPPHIILKYETDRFVCLTTAPDAADATL